LLLGLYAAGLGVMALLPFYFENLLWKADGGMRALPIPDVFLHVSVANELTHTVPPQAPGFAGVPLSYHVGNDLVVAFLAVITGTEVRDVTLRVVPPLFLGMSLLAVFCCARRWLVSDRWAVLVTFLVLFGEDLSFVFTLLFGSGSDWAAVFGRRPAVTALFLLNPMVPALGLLFCGLFCLQLYLEQKRAAWLVLSAVLFATLVEVKIFTAAHLCVSLGIAAVFFSAVYRHHALFKCAALTAMLVCPLAFAVFMRNQAGGQFALTFGGWNDDARLARTIAGQTFAGLAPLYLAILLPAVIAVGLGARVIGLGVMARTLRKPADAGAARFLAAIFVFIGILFPSVFRIVALTNPDGYDDAPWFFAHSKYVAWLFAAEVLRRGYRRLVARGRSRAVAGAWIVGTTLALSLPATALHVRNVIRYLRSTPAEDFSPAQTDVLATLARQASPGDVVLCPEDMRHAVIGLTRCRLLIGDFAESMAPRAALEARLAQVRAFWTSWDRQEVREELLQSWGARFVVAPHSDAMTDEIAARHGLRRLQSNSRYALFRYDEARAAGGKTQPRPD
jgi:hypothetical protein